MDSLTHYRETIKSILQEHSVHKPAYGDIEVELILDEQHDHYELSYIGWDGYNRIHGSIIHIDIKNGKIWIQYDGTDDEIANRLVEAGIPQSQIVLAFQPPYKRKYTDFAAA